jgi:hypothetical protein
MYPRRPGQEDDRLDLIWEIYTWIGTDYSGKLHGIKDINDTANKNREPSVAWDLCQIFAAIAGGYAIEMSPYYKGVQLIKRNKSLWERVSKFVKLKTGYAVLPYDHKSIGERWEAMNDIHSK